MDRGTVTTYLQGIIFVGGSIALQFKWSLRPGGDTSDRHSTDWVRDHYKPVVAGAMAYGYYVAAALLAGAAFPRFLQEHLFDGLAPAALVGILVDAYPRTDPARAFPKIRRPVMILLVFFVIGAMIFGLIGAAAAFSSGTNDYPPAVIATAFTGGFIFPTAYYTDVGNPFAWYTDPGRTPRGETRWAKTKWWFKKRPKPRPSPKVSERPEPHVVSKEGPAGAGSKSVMRRSGPGDEGTGAGRSRPPHVQQQRRRKGRK